MHVVKLYIQFNTTEESCKLLPEGITVSFICYNQYYGYFSLIVRNLRLGLKGLGRGGSNAESMF